jgi:hypothetical protein
MKRRNAACLLMLAAVLLAVCAACGANSKSTGDEPTPTDDDNDDASPSGDDDHDDDNDDQSPDDDDQSPDDDDDDDESLNCDVTHPDSTVGLISCLPGAYGGYTLFAPTVADTVYLIDMLGRVVHTWLGGQPPGLSVTLLENGQLLRTGNVTNVDFRSGGQAGMVMLQDWDGATPWTYTLSTRDVCTHHDAHMLPNGDILLIVWETKTVAEATAAGRIPGDFPGGVIWPDYYIEIAPVGAGDAEVVWEWHSWDHLIQDYDPAQANYGDVGAHPELIDVNYGELDTADWLHTNGIDYNAQFDEILVSVRNFSEVWVIDHGTTTAEAAGHSGGARGHGGDLLYRWGNPTAYRQTSPIEDFYGQHNGQWIAPGLPGAGDILAFNNGYGRPAGAFSTADECAPAVDADGNYPAADPAYGPAGLNWTFVDTPPTAIYSEDMGGAQRLANGNTLICVGDMGVFLEVTAAGSVVWQYVNPVTEDGVMRQGERPGDGNMSFRAYRYPPDYPGLAGQNLTPGECLVAPCQ